MEMNCALRDKESGGYTSYLFYYLSPDGGGTWHSWRMTGNVDFASSQVGWRLSEGNTGAYDLEQTRDGGQTWTRTKTVLWHGQLDFVSDQAGWAIAHLGGSTALLKTTDGGQTWAEIKPVVAP